MGLGVESLMGLDVESLMGLGVESFSCLADESVSKTGFKVGNSEFSFRRLEV